MKKSILNFVEACSESILTPLHTNELRGGRGGIDTISKTDELSDSNGDGTADDCNNEPDDNPAA